MANLIYNDVACSDFYKLSTIGHNGVAVGRELTANSYFISPDVFKHGKYPGTFRYIDLKDNGRICEVFIKEVIYANPAMIVIWSDGTRTTSHTEFGDVYSGAFGLIYCILKKTHGSDAAVALLKAWAPTPEEDLTLEKRQNRSKPVHKRLCDIRKLFKKTK